MTHFRYRTGGFEEDLLLARVPANTPTNVWGTYIGDYIHLMTIEKDFLGVFCANNKPTAANFPGNVTYLRNCDFTAAKLLDVDGVTDVAISIDPFFFKVTGVKKRADLLKDIYELAIDPLALVLPSDVYQVIIEKFHPHEPKLADIQTAVGMLSARERAFVLARARAVAARATQVESADRGDDVSTSDEGVETRACARVHPTIPTGRRAPLVQTRSQYTPRSAKLSP